MQNFSAVDAAIAYIDLEINSEKSIYNIGFVSPERSEDFDRGNLQLAYSQLTSLKDKGFIVCGHNFRRFDYPHLIQEQPQLSSWLIIDTLELSILAFPLQSSHKLNKDYRQSEYSSNNPLEDARATQQLLHQQLKALKKKPLEVQQVYTWLLTCGSEDADRAYRQLFCDLLGWTVKPIAIEKLWLTMLEGINISYLKQIWSNSENYDFDTRLCVAALLAWNYESKVPKQIFSNWLRHLPGFQNVLENLCPSIKENELLINYYLKEFGISSFRPLQSSAIKSILNQECPLVVMPTGSGKSLCYQLPALMFHERQRGLTVVISPLQALMTDQVADLEEAGFDFATFINGNISVAERRERLEQLRSGTKGLLYISPEQLRSLSIRLLLEQRPPTLWVIDEAHCISQWGHDFRPDYRYVPKYIQQLYQERQLPMPKLALVTATATLAVVEEIKELFQEYNLTISQIIDGAATRSNLTYEVIPVVGNKEQILLNKVKDSLNMGGCILIYTNTRQKAENLTQLLNQSNIDSKYYHGKLSKEEKQEVLQEFKSASLNVVVATCAFGMGINRKDVRAVIHHSMSANLESYVQEVGRAGRDGQPSTCTLLFDPKDADTSFFLQSLNQLSEQDLRNIFISVRSFRDRIYNKASSEWYWITTDEIFNSGDFDDEFGLEPEQRYTKIKVALYHLEQLGMLERAENLSTFIQFELLNNDFTSSQQQFEKYSRMQNLPQHQVQEFEQLILAMHTAKAYCGQKNEPYPLNRLSDESGISIKELLPRIRELQKASICSFEIPIKLLINKGNEKTDALKNHERFRKLEEKLLETLIELLGEEQEIQLNLRGLASRLDPDNIEKIRASSILDVLEGWVSQKWVKLNRITRDVVKIRDINVIENLSHHQALATEVLEIFYRTLGDKKGARLPLKYDLGKLAEQVESKTQLAWDSRELEAMLLWLHQKQIIRLTDGLSLFQQSLKLRVVKNVRVGRITSRYPQLRVHYEEQTRRTHFMLKYSEVPAQQRQQFIADYFSKKREEFTRLYQLPPDEEMIRPLVPDDYQHIIEPLNLSQREIVLADDPALAVIAGPGSGKTKTIVHRIAYLVKVKRVEPQRIMLLAYNRNAIRELRVRLQKVIGGMASRIRIFTFHGLALSLLGRTLGENSKTQELDFDRILQEACELIEKDEDLEDSDRDTQTRRIQLVGNLEYIFVDEYQDVSEVEYRLIKLIAGLNDSEDESRSVHINLCVIGDDDQNIYGFRGSDTKYILQFEGEYKARRLLLTENYRSTESIIQAANNLISKNQERCKRTPLEQVQIDKKRQGDKGLPVEAYSFGNTKAQATWVVDRIKYWIEQGVQPHEIAILARRWGNLNSIRLLLERAGIPTYTLKRDGIKLVRNQITCKLINQLKRKGHQVLSPEKSVQDWFLACFKAWGRNLEEPTVQILLKIARDLDAERGYGDEELAVPISATDILTALFEFNESPEVMLDEKAVLVTSCHGAKGLEFQKVVLLASDFITTADEIESERRLFYVAMTRAKEELAICCTSTGLFVQDTGVTIQRPSVDTESLPELVFYSDLTPKDIYLGCRDTKNCQDIIANLQEGTPLLLKANSYNNAWVILTSDGLPIGALSKKANSDLVKQGFQPEKFNFQPGEVEVKNIYRHLTVSDVTGEIIEDWFVVIPQIRVCRLLLL